MAANSASVEAANACHCRRNHTASNKLRTTVSAKSPPGACALLRRMGWTALTPERVEALLSLIAHSLRAQLAAPLPAHPVSPDLLPHTT